MLSERHLIGLEARGIDLDLATRMGIYTGRRCGRGETAIWPDGTPFRAQGGELVPDLDGDWLCFPFYERDKLVQVKARSRKDGAKQFTQMAGREKTFYNSDVLYDDAAMAEMCQKLSGMPLVIVEGEFDCLAVLMAGHYCVVSVPNGAPPARDKHGRLIPVPTDTSDIQDLAEDDAFSYLVRHMEALVQIQHFVIATDADEPGERLAKELVRRLGAARCSRVDYPKDPIVPDPDTGELRPVKDLDEVRQHFGSERVMEVIAKAKSWPVAGLYSIDDFQEQDLEILEIGLGREFDHHFKIYPSAFIPVTGVPNTGKSELAKQIAVLMGKNHGWHTAIFPGEEMIKPFLVESLKTKFLEKPRAHWLPGEEARADEFVRRHFSIISADPRHEEDHDITLDKLLELAAVSVFRYGTKLLIIDPWNELDHERDSRKSLTEYVGDAIRKIKKFARYYGVAVIVVAHPKKVDAQPTLYDISDSAHWYNKADNAIILDDGGDALSTIRDAIIPKVRFNGITGNKGKVQINFDVPTRMYRPLSSLPAAA